MSKVFYTVFYLNSQNFLSIFFRNAHIFSRIPNKIPPAYYLFDFLDLITDFLDFLDFLDLKNNFLDLKKF